MLTLSLLFLQQFLPPQVFVVDAKCDTCRFLVFFFFFSNIAAVTCSLHLLVLWFASHNNSFAVETWSEWQALLNQLVNRNGGAFNAFSKITSLFMPCMTCPFPDMLYPSSSLTIQILSSVLILGLSFTIIFTFFCCYLLLSFPWVPSSTWSQQLR